MRRWFSSSSPRAIHNAVVRWSSSLRQPTIVSPHIPLSGCYTNFFCASPLSIYYPRGFCAGQSSTILPHEHRILLLYHTCLAYSSKNNFARLPNGPPYTSSQCSPSFTLSTCATV